MKYIFTAVLMLIAFSITGIAQEYWWELRQPGSSLGGPIDFNKYNPDIVYYGSDNTIYKSTDRGETFSPLASTVPGASEIKCVLLDDDNPGTMLAAIESSPDKIYKTTDDGATWVISLDGASFSFFGIPMTQDPSHPDTIYTMSSANFLRSTDFGATWNIIASNFGPISAPCDIEVFPDTSIILIGDNGTGIFKSTDYGSTWSQKFTTSGEIPTVSVSFTEPGVAWATKWSGGGGLLKSTNYGETWVAQPGFNGINMWGVHIQPTDGNLVMAGCYSCGNTWRTKDGGVTWKQISAPSTNYQLVVVDSITQFTAQGAGFYKLRSDYFIPVELASFTASVVNNEVVLNWVTASELNNYGFEIQQSYDGESYNKIGFVPGFGTTTETKTYNYNVAGAPAGLHFYRLKQLDYDGTFEISPVVEVEGPMPTEFALNQNHPNPFNPSTKISFSLPVESDVTIKLFNMLGQEVAQIVNSNFQAGNHEVNFVADNLSSGAYIYVLEAAGSNGKNFNATKKMILLR